MSTERRLDPVTLSVLASALSGIAEEMGAVLVRGAYSSNIKERRDCSAALFDADGRMVAQAEHIPVHLGAMPEAVAAVRERDPRPGDVFMLNDPFRGGTHLPDITLVSPLQDGGDIIGYAVTRAHHSDVGGMRPGSMPADSTSIYQEGIVLPPVRLVREGEVAGDVLDILLANVRTPDVRRGDLRAQLAANARAQERLAELLERRGRETVLAAFTEVLRHAERRAREAIAELPDGTYEATSELEGDGVTDDDIPIAVAVTVEGDELTIDFQGTSSAVAGNVNCPLSVTRSACYFALRVLLDPEIPANAGVYAPVHVVAPEGSLVDARSPSAVVAGNVETSQRLADTVLLALAKAVDRLPAQGQGTMNNLVIGGEGYLLRDDRRRAGRVTGRRRRLGRARGHDEHAEHADRGARAGVPDARRALRTGRRVRRRRPSPRGRRHRARDPRAGAGDGVAAHRSPQAPPAGRVRRRSRSAWNQPIG